MNDERLQAHEGDASVAPTMSLDFPCRGEAWLALRLWGT